MTPVFIYALNDPVTGIVRYCGQTVDPDDRFAKHLSTAKKEKWHCARWVNSLLSKNLRPVMEILDVVPDSEADFWEREYIQNFRERGFDLTNITSGGEGGPLSPETRAKIRASLTGENHPLYGMTGEKHPSYGKKVSSETRKKISASLTGEKNSRYGKKHSLETRAKMKASWLARRKKEDSHVL